MYEIDAGGCDGMIADWDLIPTGAKSRRASPGHYVHVDAAAFQVNGEAYDWVAVVAKCPPGNFIAIASAMAASAARRSASG